MLTEGMYIADRYEVVGKVGAGGMSDVYKAKDHTLGRFVAIKVLKQEFSEDVNFVTKFRTEAQSAAGLEHPNIVNIYDVGSENGMYYIVMEYIEGITLKTYIEKKGQLSFKEAVSIAIQVGRGIESAHNKQIIHRDIKPQNIIISTEGKVKVTDFGIARAANNNTIHSDVMGSVHYSSPEQARNGFVDGKSDIYSLGIVMYEMVTGRVPFDGDTTVAVAIQHLQEEMVVPSAYAPNLPISMEKIILKCTQKSPDRRYDNIVDLLLDLKKALISPDEDFVTMVPVGQNKTRVVPQEEVEAIKKETGNIYYNNQNEDEDEEDGEDEDDDDDDSGFLNPKMEKAVTIMGIVAAVIIVIIIVYILGSVFGLFKFGGGTDKKKEETNVEEDQDAEEEEKVEKVEMIELAGKTVDEATAELNKLGLGIKNVGSVASDTYGEGQIAEQDVKAGDQVEKNTTINVKVSSGVGDIDAPDVKGDEESAAKAKIEDAGLVAKRDFESSNDVPEGTVLSQSPEAGTKVKKGDTITYVVSTGPELAQVPDVYNMTQEEAQAAIEGAGLRLVDAKSEYNDTVAEGHVSSQSIAPNKFVDPGTNISIVVSLGKKTTYYSCNTTVNTPSIDQKPNAEYSYEAKITLYKSESDESIPINGSNSINTNTFPMAITASDIADCSKGTLVIVWTITETVTPEPNPDGTPVEPTVNTINKEESRDVNFTAQ